MSSAKYEGIRETGKTTFFSSISEGETIRLILVPLFILAIVFVFWLLSLPLIDPSKMTDLGLVSVLPATFFIALILVVLSYLSIVGNLHASPVILLLHIAALILIIHGTPQIVYGTLRYSWAWKHVGIIDYIQRNGSVDPSISSLSAYHNWPGFFAFAAFFNQVAGLTSSLSYAGWGPVFFNLLDLAPLLLLFKTLTPDKRLQWLGVLLFYLFSWVGQDYFSPQAMAYFLYLVAIAIVLRWFRQTVIPAAAEARANERTRRFKAWYTSLVTRGILDNEHKAVTTPAQRLFLMATLILIFFVIASSHQLTPWMLVSALILLVLFQVTNQRYLPVLMAAFSTIWIIFMAVGFLDGNLAWIVKSIGSFIDNINGNLINLAVVSPGQKLVANVDRLLTLGAGILAIGGIIRRVRSGRWDVPAILLILSPIPMLALNAYGGEMLFRVYLFALPFIAFLAAAFFFPTPKSGKRAGTPILSSVLGLILIPAFLFSYYGKDRMYYFSPNEVALAQYLFTSAPKGSLIVDGTVDWPMQFSNYENYNYLSLQYMSKAEIAKIMANPAGELAVLMDEAAYGSVNISQPQAIGKPDTAPSVPGVIDAGDYPAAYLVITRSQIAQVEMTGILPQNFFQTIATSLSRSKNFRVLIANSDVILIEFTHAQEP